MSRHHRHRAIHLSCNSSMSSPSSSSTPGGGGAATTRTVSCLAGILRRLLCSRTLPTHPTDHITESASIITASEGLEKADNKAAPSVVAKLMGLDSMPNVISITRLNTALSFRENEEFFVLSFENEGEKKESRSKERKCEKGIGEFQQRCEESSVNLNSGVSKLRRKKKKKKVKNVELKCSSEESSPVSVLDFDQFIIDHEVPTSDSMESNSRRKLSPEPENYESQLRRRNDNSLLILDDLKTEKAEGKCVGSRKKDCSKQICKVVEAEILESNWLCSKNILKHEDFEDIYADFESQILDQLLHELVIHQLIGLLFVNFWLKH